MFEQEPTTQPLAEEIAEDILEGDVIELPPVRQASALSAESDSAEPPFDLVESLVRLLVGSTLVSVETVQSRLQAWEAEARVADAELPPPEPTAFAKHVAIGLMFEGLDRTRQARQLLWKLTRASAKTGATLTRPLTRSFLFAPLRAVARQAQAAGEERLVALANRGRLEEPQARQLALKMAPAVMDEIVRYLTNNTAVHQLVQSEVSRVVPELQADAQLDSLVDSQVARVVDKLVENTAVQKLVRAQADIYIGHLQENPEPIQDIVQGQSLGLATEVMDEVREKTVTADTLIEEVVRRILRRPPRSELPLPPPEVRKRAGRQSVDL